MKKILIAFAVVLLLGATANAGSTKVISSAYHTCALDGDGVVCWGGKNYDGELDVPQLRNPTMVAVGKDKTCAIDDSGLKCWGSNESGQNNVPELKNPTSVVIGAYVTCASHDLGVRCWGKSKFNDSLPEGTINIKNAKSVSIGQFIGCLIDTSVVKCWGEPRYLRNMPAFSNPKVVTVGTFHACVLDDSGVKCWGNNDKNQLNVPFLKNPKSISANNSVTCATEDSGIKCWGDDSDDIILNAPKLNKPTFVTVGSSVACALSDESGVICWGSKYDYGKTQVIPQILIRNEEIWRKEERVKLDAEEARKKAAEEKRRSKLAKHIPSGSKFVFKKEILVEAGKATVLIGTEAKNLKQCILIVEPDNAKDRIIKSEKEYIIREVESLEDNAELETSFILEGTPITISCFADYPNIATIGEITDSLLGFGINLETLPIPEPDEL